MFKTTNSDKTFNGFMVRHMETTEGKIVGAVKVMAQGNGVVYVEFPSPCGITVGNHLYHGSAHLTFDTETETWNVMGKPHFYRTDRKDPTTAAARTLTLFLFDVAMAFVVAHPYDMVRATTQMYTNEIARHEGYKADHMKKVREEDKIIADLKQKLALC